MANIFQNVKANRPQNSGFDLSHERKFTCNMGELVPILVQEVVPGDKFQVTTEMLVRLAPLATPTMHRINTYTHFFFVPNRLVHNKWQEAITGGEDGNDQTIIPRIKLDAVNWDTFSPLFTEGTLADYMGIPTIQDNYGGVDLEINALPFRAYQLIYNEYYRDQNLQEKVEQVQDSGFEPNGTIVNTLTMRQRNWEKDYYTSCLPFPQKGEPVLLPLAGMADIVLDPSVTDYNYNQKFRNAGTGATSSTVSAINNGANGAIVDATSKQKYVDPNHSLKADLSTTTASTINDLREAFQIQKWLERNARSGSRYIESILSHFGVKTSDYRLQRPEYLGGGKSPIVISEVLQTSHTVAETPQGNMAGHGFGFGETNTFNKYFEEHGYIIGIMSVLPTTAYQQGIPRHFLRKDKFDYYWPEFANLGEQEVSNHEIFFDGTNDLQPFGYQQRYAEYRYTPSSVHGDFKNTLAKWHMGRVFDGEPGLNAEFVEAHPTHDIFAVTDESEDKLFIQLYNKVKAIRPMPYLAEPGFIDH
nr:MAG: major capsid protein [Microvirus sp.]